MASTLPQTYVEKAWLKVVDTALFVIANLVNLLMVGIFLSRAFGWGALEDIFGITLLTLAIPVGIIAVVNAWERRAWWAMVLPAILVIFFVVELFLDYILLLEFRTTALLWPYLVLYYASLMGMIGYTFLIRKSYGVITLITYFLQLFATWYSYSLVGHG